LNFRRIARFTGITLLSYVFVSFFRIILLVVFPNQTNEFFKSGLLDSIAITLYLLLSSLFTMSLILLVSRRLLAEVQTEKEKYNSTFNSSPYAIMLTRMADGKIFDVNEGFVSFAGYQPSEVMGKTTLSTNLWVKDEDCLIVVNELSKGYEVRDLEMQFRNKSGSIITGLLSAKLIVVNNEKCVLTSISDITEMCKMRQELHDLAMHDVLTGLPNRKLFYDRFEIARANAQRENEKIAIISMDID
jgi:PAS domain S-box-containing protein